MAAIRRLLLLLVLPSLAGALLCVSAPAQTAGAEPRFDVASIHVNKTATDGHHHLISDPAESHFRTANLGLRDLIQFAYGLPSSQIVGGGGWLDSVMFDIDAKADATVDAELHALPTEQARQQKQAMVRALLADRFQLKAHQETRQLPEYALVLAKDGPKFKASLVNGTTIDTGRGRLHIAGSDDTVGLLSRELALMLGRVVVNETNLSGRYDLALKWTADEMAAALSATDTLPDLFTALQEQLGLKLKSTRGPVPVLVIDNVQMPSAN